MQVQNIMSRHPVVCRAETPLPEVARLMLDNDCGEIPVCDASGRPIGVVTDRDIAVRTIAVGRNPLDMTARDCMTSPVITVHPEDDVEDCCKTLAKHRIRRAPVIDAKGVCCGMVSQADIAELAPGQQAAELVREVSKHDTGRSHLVM